MNRDAEPPPAQRHVDPVADGTGDLLARSLTPELLERLENVGREQAWARGRLVVREGEPAGTMYLVKEGQLRVSVSGGGARDVELTRLGAGDYFGELMLASETRTASVRTLTDCVLVAVSREQFIATLSAHPRLAFALVQHLIERVTRLSSHVRGLASLDVYGRLVEYLETSATEQAGRLIVPGRLTQQALAERLGASRAMINRLLRDLLEGGYIERQRDGIVLLKRMPRRW